jgi:hypothetical protein
MNVSALVSNAKDALTRGNKKGASDLLNFSLIKLSELTIEGQTHVDNASVDRWKERVWQLLEENDLIEE